MLKLVTLSALLAVAATAPQYFHYPVYNPYPFPYYHPLMAYTRTAVAAPAKQPIPSPYYFPAVIPYNAYPPVASPVAQDPVPVIPQQIPQHQQQPLVTPGFRIPAEEPVHTSIQSGVNKSPSLQLAELILTPEQKRQLEEAVAAMNPLEFAARLEVVKDPREAMRIFDTK